jgi:hypothetical protein
MRHGIAYKRISIDGDNGLLTASAVLKLVPAALNVATVSQHMLLYLGGQVISAFLKRRD